MVKQRRQYQRGLLAWLRGDEDGAKTMRDAIAAIEDATTHQNLRAFWWTTGALFDALNERGLEGGFGVKQLAARIDLQIRRVVEGSAKVADRLRREVLYYVAIAAPVAPSVQAVQKSFKLGGLIPSAEVLDRDLVRIQPLLRDARDQLAAAKDSWLKFTSGRAENLPKLKQTLTSVHKCAAEIGNGALMKLTAGWSSAWTRCRRRSVLGTAGDGVRDRRCCSRKARPTATRTWPPIPEAGRGDAVADRCRARVAPGPRRHGGADARRDVEARAGARCCWRRSAARSRPISATWSRCSTPSSATTASARNSGRWPGTAPRSAAP